MFVVQLAYLAFFSIALPDSMLGVAWPSMRLAFGQPLSAAGLVPPVGVAAAVLSTTSFSKVPPVALSIFADTLSVSL